MLGCFVAEEDYLRILRYFRFFGVMGAKTHDPKVLKTIKERVEGLAGISGERIWMEIKKLAVGPNAPSIFETMNDCGILKYIGLSSVHEQQLETFKIVYERSTGLDVLPVTVMTALFKDENDLSSFHKRVRLSNDENDIALLILHFRKPENNLTSLKCCVDVAVEMDARNHSKIKEKLNELLKYNGAIDLIEQLNKVEIPKFPVSGMELASAGIKQGPQYGRILDRMRTLWRESNFKLTNEQLMSNIEKIIDQLMSQKDELKSNPKLDEFVLAKKRRRILSK